MCFKFEARKGLFSDGMREGLHGNLLDRKADLPAGTAVLGKVGGLVLDSVCSELISWLEAFLAFSFHCNCPLQGFSCALIREEPLFRYKESPSDGAEPRQKVTSRAILFTILDRILPVFAAGSESAPYIWLCDDHSLAELTLRAFLLSHSEPEWDQGHKGESFPSPL